MSGKTHAIVGMNAIWILPALGLVDWRVFPFLFAGLIGGWLPDIDARESELHDETYNFTKIFFINKIFGHRRFFHSFLANGLFYLILRLTLPPSFYGLAEILAIAYFSHIFIDGFNTKGCTYLYPSNWCINWVPEFMQSPCGGWADDLLFILGAMGLGAFTYEYGGMILGGLLAR